MQAVAELQVAQFVIALEHAAYSSRDTVNCELREAEIQIEIFAEIEIRIQAIAKSPTSTPKNCQEVNINNTLMAQTHRMGPGPGPGQGTGSAQ